MLPLLRLRTVPLEPEERGVLPAGLGTAVHVVEGIQSRPSAECVEGDGMMVMVLCREQHHASGQQTRQEDQQRVEDEVRRVAQDEVEGDLGVLRYVVSEVSRCIRLEPSLPALRDVRSGTLVRWRGCVGNS